MTIAVNLGRKATKQTNKKPSGFLLGCGIHTICFFLCNLIYNFTLIYLEISDSNDIAPFEVFMNSISGLLHG